MRLWRFLETPPLCGEANMAIDAALLAQHARGLSPPTLRLYRFSPAAVSTGYFQRRHGFDLEACATLGIDVVRRPTGGKAILHGRDLCYSVIGGADDGISSTVAGAYTIIAQGLLAGLELVGVRAQMAEASARAEHADICFLRTTVGAVLYEGRKLIGSAQTWQGGSMLQHGSIAVEDDVDTMLQVLGDAPKDKDALRKALREHTTSLREILGCTPDPGELSRAIREGMTRALGVSLVEGTLTQEESALLTLDGRNVRLTL